MKDDRDKTQLKELAKRFVVHIYACVEASNGPEECKEMVFSFFLHVIGKHSWNGGKFDTIIPVRQATTVGTKFSKESTFQHFRQCAHEIDNFVGQHPNVDPNASAYQTLIEIASTNLFISDLAFLAHGNSTAYVESFHNVCIKYRPKRRYFAKKSFENRTMLAAIAFNVNREAELHGRRSITEAYQCISKRSGEKRWKYKKGPIEEKWKSEIVNQTFEKKRLQGAYDPKETLTDEELEEQEDILIDLFDQAMHIEEEEEIEDL